MDIEEFKDRTPVEESTPEAESAQHAAFDPRASLATWANTSDEWVRNIVKQVMATGGPLSKEEVEYAYSLFREEKALDTRTLPAEGTIFVEAASEESELPVTIKRISDVTGVNALVVGAVIEPHVGLSILFGENGTGKTGYARILKSLANSRSADEILGDIQAHTPVSKSASIEYSLGQEGKQLKWTGEQGVAPFTRMSVFDSPCVTFHVDDDLEYVYVPNALALFNHVTSGIKAVQEMIDEAIRSLSVGTNTYLSRFQKEATVYPVIETLGASTDLGALKTRANADPRAPEQVDVLRRAVAAIESDSVASKLTQSKRLERVLDQTKAALTSFTEVKWSELNDLLEKYSTLSRDYEAFRTELFAKANLPADPEDNWEAFVSAGDAYRHHLESLGVHDPESCLYCRQSLSTVAQDLVRRYGDYIADKIKLDLNSVATAAELILRSFRSITIPEVSSLLSEYRDRADKPATYEKFEKVELLLTQTKDACSKSLPVADESLQQAKALLADISTVLESTSLEVQTMQGQSENKSAALIEKKKELAELSAAAELHRSWAEIELRATNLKEADRLKSLIRGIPNVVRNVTDLAKIASNHLINLNFDNLFREECEALRAPTLSIEYVGRQGRAQRRKVLSGRKPSKVLSEGEQKVLAMADFLAEARLAGISAPVIFDDPVSSLDHRRINEVAKRVANLSESCQVIVFTHDIFFATTLLGLLEKSKRCSYFHITDDNGKGQVTRASGPRWDTLGNIKKELNLTIQAANGNDGETRASLVRTGYDWLRSWCEVFVEQEVLKGVTQRYQPNVRMTVLSDIKVQALPATISVVQRIFEEACRYIDGHSQPLVTLGVSPTLSGLEAHWSELQAIKKALDDA